MDYPILAAWSDPAVKDASLLLALADVDHNVAAGVVANPNFPAEHLKGTIARIPLTVDRAQVIGQYATTRLSVADQVRLLERSAARTEAACSAIANGMTDAALVAALGTQALSAKAKKAAACAVRDRAESVALSELSDDLREAVAAAARHTRPSVAPTYATIRAWQLVDPARMTELLERLNQAIYAHGRPTVGIPGLADDWFARGGQLRANAAQDPDITVGPVLEWLADATPADAATIVALCENPAIPVEALIETTLRIHQLRWSTTVDDRATVAARAKQVGDALDQRLAITLPPVTGPVTQMRDGLAELAAVTQAGTGTWVALLLNPHTPVHTKRHLLERTRGSRLHLSPLVEQELLRLVDAGELGPDDVVGWVHPAQGAGELTWRAARAQASDPPAGSTVRTRLARVTRRRTAAVHADAPHLATVLTKASAWVRMLELGENGQRYEEALAAVTADQQVTSRAAAMAALLGNAFGDD